MLQPEINKLNATSDENLAYLVALTQTIKGLEKAQKKLTERRVYADPDEVGTIDDKLDDIRAEWTKENIHLDLYLIQNISFKPPTPEKLEELLSIVRYLDGVISAVTHASAIITKTAELVAIFRSTQA